MLFICCLFFRQHVIDIKYNKASYICGTVGPIPILEQGEQGRLIREGWVFFIKEKQLKGKAIF